MTQHMLQALRLSAQQEWYRQQYIRHQLAQHEHRSVEQHLFLVAYLTVDIADCCNRCKKGARIQYSEQSKDKSS